MRFKLLAAALLLFGSAGYLRADLFINEIDYDTVGTDNAEWVEIVGTAGQSLNAYEVVMISQAGAAYGTFDLAPANFTFTNETGTGWGFFVLGIVGAEYGVSADYTPAGTWTVDEIQNGGTDSIQLRLKAGPTNVHLIDYEGQNPNTTEDQMTNLADTNTDARTSLYLTGTGNSFASFTFSVTPGNGTPGAINVAQTLTAIPEPTGIIFGGLICCVLGTAAAWRRLSGKIVGLFS